VKERAVGVVGGEGGPARQVRAVLKVDRAAEGAVPRDRDAGGGALNDDDLQGVGLRRKIPVRAETARRGLGQEDGSAEKKE
jgi:hypothetical protein